ncbi:MAG: hypothetical protein RIT43_687 [Bacteroidota bacterium]|jgi:hypothetical protein
MFPRKAKTVLLSFLLVFQSLLTFAQVIEPKHTFNIELGLPNGLSNPAFKNIMQGLVNVSAYYQYDFKYHLTLGIGGRYGYFGINEFKVPSPVLGGGHSAGGFLKVGYQKFMGPRFAMDLGLKVGYSQFWFKTNRNDTLGINPVVTDGIHIEPTVGLILTADEQNSYRFFVSYQAYGFAFKPSMIGLETFGGYDPADFGKPTGCLVIGFGYTYYFVKKE